MTKTKTVIYRVTALDEMGGKHSGDYKSKGEALDRLSFIESRFPNLAVSIARVETVTTTTPA